MQKKYTKVCKNQNFTNIVAKNGKKIKILAKNGKKQNFSQK